MQFSQQEVGAKQTKQQYWSLQKCLNISSVNAKEKGQRSEVIQAICLLFFSPLIDTLKICIHLFSQYLDSTRLLICTISRFLKDSQPVTMERRGCVESWRMLKDKNKLQTSRYLSEIWEQPWFWSWEVVSLDERSSWFWPGPHC